MNSRPSSPICQNCAQSELYCQCVRELESRKCCDACEHDLPPDLRG